MRFHSFVLAFLCCSIATVVANTHDAIGLNTRHHARPRSRRTVTRRCPSRASATEPEIDSTSSSSSTSTTAWTSTSTSIWKPESTSNSSPASLKASVPNLLSVTSTCGDSGATQETTAQSGPNGNIYWLNCGISDGGWKPPYVSVDQVVAKDWWQALQDPNSPFQACSSFAAKFSQYASENGLPPILLASFAMQESSCNPATVGGAGEQGLMQLTHDKCVDAPGGNCQDIDYNISTGAKYFKTLLDSNGGDLILSIGSYNGWYKGLTYTAATAAASTSCCRCQNNLDYLHQFLNGWLQNINAYSNNLGMYHNLDQCH